MMLKGLFLASSGCLALLAAAPAAAQTTETPETEAQPARARGGVSALTDDIVVTARKRGEERLQDVPIAATAFGTQQLEAQNFRDLQSLSFSMPNVQLDGVGTSKGIANFTIRGLGINSSIPSIEPTVGVFVDGIYYGITSGVIFDNFDLEGVEVLRGPQGVLFGRNVTGGAILLRTTMPTDTLKGNFYAGIETGPQYTVHGTVSGPLVDGLLSAKIAAYHSDDDGWFTKNAAGSKTGKSKMTVLRGALRFTPGDLDAVLRFEHGDTSGQPTPVQNHALFSRKSFDYAVPEPGFFDSKWNQLTLEGNLKVEFGDGTITSISGWRHFKNEANGPTEGTFRTPGIVNGIDFGVGAKFDIGWFTDQEQWSQELRYAGTFGAFDITTGLYYFTQDLLYVERRVISTDLTQPDPAPLLGGGDGRFSSFGAFGAMDFHASDTLTFNLGLRYTTERKKGIVARQRRVGNILDGLAGADYDTLTLVPFAGDDPFKLKFHNWSPKVGFQWKPNDDAMLYGFWAIAYRSGGINFRHSGVTIPPSPFDPERQESFEIGGKVDLFDKRLRINAAAFRNKIKDMLRDQSTPDALAGTQQIVRNTGNARVQGFEGEATLKITDNLLLSGQFGYLDGKYLKLNGDLTGDLIVNDVDYALKLPRLSPWTYGASVVYDLNIGDSGIVTTRVSWNHRDKNYISDNNRGYALAVDMVDANITFRLLDSGFSFSLYGTNLLHETTYGSDSILPATPGFGDNGTAGPLPTFSPLNKGRVLGANVRYSF